MARVDEVMDELEAKRAFAPLTLCRLVSDNEYEAFDKRYQVQVRFDQALADAKLVPQG